MWKLDNFWEEYYNDVCNDIMKTLGTNNMRRNDNLWTSMKVLTDNIDTQKEEKQIRNEDGTISFFLNVPGYNKDNLKVNFQSKYLKIKGSKNEKDLLEYSQYLGDVEIVSAKVIDGVLEVRYKEKEKDKGMEIKLE